MLLIAWFASIHVMWNNYSENFLFFDIIFSAKDYTCHIADTENKLPVNFKLNVTKNLNTSYFKIWKEDGTVLKDLSMKELKYHFSGITQAFPPLWSTTWKTFLLKRHDHSIGSENELVFFHHCTFWKAAAILANNQDAFNETVVIKKWCLKICILFPEIKKIIPAKLSLIIK